jgi:hypothetical protein
VPRRLAGITGCGQKARGEGTPGVVASCRSFPSPQQQGKCSHHVTGVDVETQLRGSCLQRRHNATAARDRAALRTAMGHRDRAGGCGGTDLPTDPRPPQQGPQPADRGTLVSRVCTKIETLTVVRLRAVVVGEENARHKPCPAHWILHIVARGAARLPTPLSNFCALPNELTEASTLGC